MYIMFKAQIFKTSVVCIWNKSIFPPRLYIYQSIYHYTYLYNFLSIYLSISDSFSLFFPLPLSLYLSLFLSLSLSLSLALALSLFLSLSLPHAITFTPHYVVTIVSPLDSSSRQHGSLEGKLFIWV